MTNIYSNTLVNEPVAILAGGDTSGVLDLTKLELSGTGSLMRLTVGSNFPACTMTFLALDSAEESAEEYPLKITDGIDKIELSVTFDGAAESIILPAYWFSSIAYLKIKISVMAAEDLTFFANCQPIFQGGT